MVASLPDLLKDLDRALAAGDLEALNAVRRTIADGHPETDAGAEAAYKLGLAALFLEGKLDDAGERFRAAAKSKSTAWSPAARTSLGIVLWRQGKPQQAVFELRKVASAKPPTIASAQALGFVVLVHRETNNGPEAERARTEQMKLLGEIARSPTPGDAALANFMLGMEFKYEGRRPDARRHLEAALASHALSTEDEDRIRGTLNEL
jgi:tetratricopeptide (TPR) repeat protein